MYVTGPRVGPADPSVIKELEALSPSTLGHFREEGFVSGLRPNLDRVKVVGSALTVQVAFGDSVTMHCALDDVRAGDVVVLDMLGDCVHACWGGVVCFAAMQRGAVGAIVDGAITDVGQIRDMGFPVYFRSVSAVTGRLLGYGGSVGLPVTVGGVRVCPGDIVFGDENGVAIIPLSEASELAARVAARESREPSTIEKLQSGASLADLTGARQLWDRH